MRTVRFAALLVALAACSAFGADDDTSPGDAPAPDPDAGADAPVAVVDAGALPAEASPPDASLHPCDDAAFCDDFERDDEPKGPWDEAPGTTDNLSFSIDRPDGGTGRVLAMRVTKIEEFGGTRLTKTITRGASGRMTIRFRYFVPNGLDRKLDILSVEPLEQRPMPRREEIVVYSVSSTARSTFQNDDGEGPGTIRSEVNAALPIGSWIAVTARLEFVGEAPQIAIEDDRGLTATPFASSTGTPQVRRVRIGIGVDYATPGPASTVYFDDVTVVLE